MKKAIKKISLLASLLAVLILPYFVFASSPLINNLQNVGEGSGYSGETDSNTLSAIAGSIVAAVLGLLGVIFIILIVYAGVLWMTAAGDEQKIEKAQKILRNAVIGLIITVSAYALYQLINLFIYKNLK